LPAPEHGAGDLRKAVGRRAFDDDVAERGQGGHRDDARRGRQRLGSGLRPGEIACRDRDQLHLRDDSCPQPLGEIAPDIAKTRHPTFIDTLPRSRLCSL
jgi:hypothetical protein